MTDERLDPLTRDRIRLLLDSRNHAIVSILEDAGEPMHVRELAERLVARRRLPEATVWKPRLDWTNAASYPRLGRLVMADRRTVMLGILDRPGGDGSGAEETAVLGEGEDNPLVMFVRELLGPRLDHLDYQSEGFGNPLHS